MKLVMLLIVGASCVPQSTSPSSQLKGKALRDHVNSHQSHWKAEVPTRSHINHLMKVAKAQVPESAAKASPPTEPVGEAYASGFDAREQWPNCTSISYIRDQSECGSCWAFATAEALTDRICIVSNGALKPFLSAQDILTCCTGTCGSGCDGGTPYYAWYWLISNGVSTGNGYYENTGCKPYSIQPCGTRTVNSVTYTYEGTDCLTNTDVPTPQCTSTCSNSAYNISYKADKYFAQSAYWINTGVAAIQQDILTNGPVVAGFNVYTDFDLYVSGIYTQTGGSLVGGHEVKLIGWGTENGVDYWLAANSWGPNFGENGFFRIVRGVDECGIESSVVAGLPGQAYYAPKPTTSTTTTPTTTTPTTTSTTTVTTTTTGAPTTTCAAALSCPAIGFDANSVEQGPITCASGTWKYVCSSSSKSLNVKRVSNNNKWAPVSTVKCMADGWYIDNVLIKNLTDITQVKCLASGDASTATTTTTLAPTTTTTTTTPATTTAAATTTTTHSSCVLLPPVVCPTINVDTTTVKQGPFYCNTGNWLYSCISGANLLNVQLVSNNNNWTQVSYFRCTAPGQWSINNVNVTNLADITLVKCLPRS